ncbi:MAG TPA: DUF3775 domain-containing protein [Methylovirgula sp.]|nr:DUF3775 domain-containing protein [Methylovirgula sp.]
MAESKDVDPDIPGPEINPDKVCFVIAKARELEAEDEGVEPDDSNPTDDEFLSILTESAYGPTRRELVAFINAMDDDEKAELVALTWTGRGDYSAREWRVAVAEARARREVETSVYLLGIPLLSDYLEDGLAEFDLSCNDFNAREIG